MGIELLGGPNEQFDLSRATKWVADVVNSPEEKFRRTAMRRRVCLYRDDFEPVLQEAIGNIFESAPVRERLYKLGRLAGYSSFLKRVSDEVARPIYASAPTRHVYKKGERAPKGRPPAEGSAFDEAGNPKLPPPGPAPGAEALKKARETFDELAKQAGWGEAMDTAARLLVACSPVFIIGRYVKDIGPVFDVATGDTVSVIPHPERPTKALAIAYDKVSVTPMGARVVTTAVVDDTRSFEVSADGAPIGVPVEHGLGRIPVVEVHARGRWGSYWSTRGQDLEAASVALMVLAVVALKKHKSQSHRQLVATGEGVSSGMPKNQILDEESVLIVEGAGSIDTIDLEADPSGLHSTAERIENTTAANYGLSRDRMNQTSTVEQNAALNERTSEAAGVMGEAECDTFDLLCRLSQSGPEEKRLDPKELRLCVDYRALSMRLDPKSERELWEMDIKAGLRDPLDNIYALNPEIKTDEEAWAYAEHKLANRAAWVVRARALNIATDSTATEPGQAAQQNGAMGPAVRDGQMTKDEAAEKAKGPPSANDDPEENDR